MASGLILVSGLGRCGTSLLMQMLSAGGWPVFEPAESTWPAFEHHAINKGLRGVPAGATGLLKWIDPHRVKPPKSLRGSVFLTRDSKQQARSAFKLMGVRATRLEVEAMAESYRRDKAIARQVLAARGPVCDLTFERLVLSPRQSLEKISAWLEEPLDFVNAIVQLRPRETGVECLPYLIEERLLAEQNRRVG